MIKKILYSTAIFVAFCACTKTNVTINGKIKGAEKQMVYLEQQNVNQNFIIDSVKINSAGEFKFKFLVESPTFFNIKVGNQKRITILAEPDAQLELSGNYKDFAQNYWIDSQTSDHSLWIKLLNFQLEHTHMAMDSLQKKYKTLPKDEAHLPELQQIAAAWDSVVVKQIEFSKDFILKHAISPAAYYALYQKFNTGRYILTPEQHLQSYKIVASSLKALYPESQYTKAILSHLEKINKQLQAEKLRQLIANSENNLPELRLPNAQGDTLLLSALRGKYIILDFTVLNAKESPAYIESLKKIHQKFKQKGVTIYQVCLDKNPESWKNLVSRLGIGWNCVQDASGRGSQLWNVQSLPSNYIISPTYEIVGKNLQGKRLEERLTELLKK